MARKVNSFWSQKDLKTEIFVTNLVEWWKKRSQNQALASIQSATAQFRLPGFFMTRAKIKPSKQITGSYSPTK